MDLRKRKGLSAIPFSNLTTVARTNPIHALGFLLIAGADKYQLRNTTCLKEAQWAKEN